MSAIPLALVSEGPRAASATWLKCLAIVGRSHGLNLTIEHLVKDNLLSSEEVTPQEMIACARAAGLKARMVTMAWEDLDRLKKALPAVLRLRTGEAMVLTEVEFRNDVPHVILRDPDAEEGSQLVIDRARLEEIWTGELVLLRREYKLSDEEKPFGWGLVIALFLREKRLVRDLLLGALALSMLALTPMIFWRIITGEVLTYRAFNTFTVLCVGVSFLFLFEGLLTYLRHYLLQIVTARVDTRMSELLFDRLLDLQIDFFERNPVGQISHDINEITKIRRFINEQGFGTLLDSLTLLIFLPVMFAFSPELTFIVLGISALMAGFLLFMLPFIRTSTSEVIAAETAKGTFLYQNLAGIRTVKSLSLESRQRAVWDVLTIRVSDALFHAGHLAGIIQGVVRPLSQIATSGALAIGVYQAMEANNPVAVGDLFAFIILVGRVQGRFCRWRSSSTSTTRRAAPCRSSRIC